MGILAAALLLNASGCGDSATSKAPAESAASSAEAAERATEPAVGDPMRAAGAALRRGDLEAAEVALRQHLVGSPEDGRALETLGDIAARRGELDKATTLYASALESLEDPPQTLFDKQTDALMRLRRPFQTIAHLEATLRAYPNHVQAHFDLAGLSTMVGLPDKALPSLRWLAQRNRADADTLLVLADPSRVTPDPELANELLAEHPENRRPVFSLALLDASEMDWLQVARRLEPVVERHPDFVPAQTLYGQALVELDRGEAVQRWQRSVPAGAKENARYWIAAGTWAQRHGQHAEAARAFWEAMRRDLTGNPQLMMSLSTSLNRLGREQASQKLAAQIRRHSTLRDALRTHLERSSTSQAAALRVSEALMELGRIWEAEAWARMAASLPDDRQPDLRERYRAIRSQLTKQTPWQLPERMVAKQMDLSGLPLIAWDVETDSAPLPTPTRRGQLAFADEASQRGWKHTCRVAPETKTEGHWIYQSVGGGVGVIDYDLDGWPDLAAAMLDGQPLTSDSSPNALYRNLAGQFAETGRQAGYTDGGFGQGITVADFNGDGFPDLLDANIGRNRLYRNNGDGTFTEVAEAAGLSSRIWSTSCAVADLDADGLADVFEVAYCRGRAPYEQPCRNEQGYSTCPPLHFDAEADRVWRGGEDGSFADVSEQWLEEPQAGRGLGLVVGELDERQGLDVYVANDMTVNHLWSADRSGDPFRMNDLGAIRGLGFSGQSLAQASMGIAADDADGDGDIDLFVTHFADDHNTYYEQIGEGLWADRSSQVGLAQPSRKLLGFGTEWVDFDNDGSLELLVGNGHVDDVNRPDVGYSMPPQLFGRTGDGGYVEYQRDALGEYFTQDHLARALATVDVDRDGRVDAAMTHLYEPVALLVNRSERAGQAVGLELKATRSHRDAIGAVVTCTVGSRTVTKQVLAGDGYMCSNQRRLSIGTASVGKIGEVKVIWPSGEVEAYGHLNSGYDYLLIEGAGQAHRLHGHQQESKHDSADIPESA